MHAGYAHAGLRPSYYWKKGRTGQKSVKNSPKKGQKLVIRQKIRDSTAANDALLLTLYTCHTRILGYVAKIAKILQKISS